MKKLGKFLFWMAGFLYTIEGYKRVKRSNRMKELKKECYEYFGDLDTSIVRHIWNFVNIVAFLIAWPLWIVQVILDLTLNKD